MHCTLRALNTSVYQGNSLWKACGTMFNAIGLPNLVLVNLPAKGLKPLA